jgi:hypothetical protein
MSGTDSTTWFWADWRSDTGVQASSLGARALWFEMLGIAGMNKGKEYGFVLINGKKPSAADIAKHAHCTVEEVERGIPELEKNRVFSRDRRGVIYCRRMVKAEKNRGNARVGFTGKAKPGKENQDSLGTLPFPSTPETQSKSKSQRVPRAAARTTLAPDWQLTVANLEYAKEHGFDRQAAYLMAEAFADHHRSRGNRMACWDAAWRNWVRNETKFGRRGPPPTSGAPAGALRYPPRGGGFAEVHRMLREGDDNATDASAADHSGTVPAKNH